MKNKYYDARGEEYKIPPKLLGLLSCIYLVVTIPIHLRPSFSWWINWRISRNLMDGK